MITVLFVLLFCARTQAAPVFRANVERVAALTFDDGPKEHFTDELLAILKEKNVRATFFLLGVDIEQRPDDARKIISSGHAIGNHSMTHANLKKMTLDEARKELRDCSDLIEKLGGKRPRLMRPPGGQYNETVLKACEVEKLTPVFWTNNPGDYLDWKSPEALAEKVLKSRRDGDIILLHLGLEQTIKALPAIIEGYRAAGFTFVTAEEL